MGWVGLCCVGKLWAPSSSTQHGYLQDGHFRGSLLGACLNCDIVFLLGRQCRSAVTLNREARRLWAHSGNEIRNAIDLSFGEPYINTIVCMTHTTQENIITSIVMTFALFFIFAGVLRDYGHLLDWYTEDLDIDYRPIPLFTWIAHFWAILMTLGYPLLLLAWRQV